MSVEDIISSAQEQQVMIVPMLIPIPVFKFLNEIAVREGKTVSGLVIEILRDGINLLDKKHSKGG
jgi:hypothetical protein